MARAKHWLKRNIPAPLLRPVFSWRSKHFAKKFRNARPDEVFTDIFATNHWGSSESISGPGSEDAATRNISAALPRIIRDYKIRSVLDAPCGDFHWMQRVDLGEADYTGGDIVKPLVEALSKKYSSPRRRFMELDITSGPIPEVDLIFCRDCFIHLPFKLIKTALNNFRNSAAKFVLLTSDKDWPFNYDTSIGGARSVDLCAWPFDLPQPLEIIQEQETPDDGGPIKCMALWPIESLAALKV